MKNIISKEYIRPTPTIDCDSAVIRERSKEIISGSNNVQDKAKRLFYFVRDKIKYGSVVDVLNPESYKASRTLMRGYGLCIHKAVLLAAISRSVLIPSRLCLVYIQNHLMPDYMLAFLETNVVLHGYDELYIRKSWVKATPMFDAGHCERHGYIPVEFDGIHDALLPPHDWQGRRHIEYLDHKGCFADLQFDLIEESFADMGNW
jgi:transglutaminase-like putative cysteine protease